MLFRPLLLAFAFATVPAAAAPPQGFQLAQMVIEPGYMVPAQDRGQRQNIISLREVVDMVRGRFGGELISARLEQGGRPVYVLRWRMPNADVQDIRVDATSGQFR